VLPGPGRPLIGATGGPPFAARVDLARLGTCRSGPLLAHPAILAGRAANAAPTADQPAGRDVA